jgi:hypothetical protein
MNKISEKTWLSEDSLQIRWTSNSGRTLRTSSFHSLRHSDSLRSEVVNCNSDPPLQSYFSQLRYFYQSIFFRRSRRHITISNTDYSSVIQQYKVSTFLNGGLPLQNVSVARVRRVGRTTACPSPENYHEGSGCIYHLGYWI